ncbi:IBR finger domain protein [Lasiosphaeris hirsuta]|uniref:IBR finger domain protein n=1 Tax=Lasiosphaeris hirsuta TaxID=260670 RepID=A0AA40EE17_9PEZI|nr:IBR finger domain protein [Lasiosphaeris hirsuta]
MAAPKKTVLITGCSDGGLGAHLALAFHNAGWRVFASGRNLAKLSVVQQAGIETIPLDVLSDTSIAAAAASITQLTGGPLDALVNNAGQGYSMPVLDLDLATARAVFDINVWSLVAVTRAFLPLLRAAPCGLLVNNTSMSSQIGATVPYTGAYSASKAAAASLTEALRIELVALGIRVINLQTGSVKSGFAGNRAAKAEIPATSAFSPVKAEVEAAMAEGEIQDGDDPTVWAAAVVADLSRAEPPYWIWRGKFAALVRLTNFLPIGFMDGKMKKLSGLDTVERKMLEHDKAAGGKVKGV